MCRFAALGSSCPSGEALPSRYPEWHGFPQLTVCNAQLAAYISSVVNHGIRATLISSRALWGAVSTSWCRGVVVGSSSGVQYVSGLAEALSSKRATSHSLASNALPVAMQKLCLKQLFTILHGAADCRCGFDDSLQQRLIADSASSLVAEKQQAVLWSHIQ